MNAECGNTAMHAPHRFRVRRGEAGVGNCSGVPGRSPRIGRVRYRSGWSWLCDMAGVRWSLDIGGDAPYLWNNGRGAGSAWWLMWNGSERYMASRLSDAMDSAALAFREREQETGESVFRSSAAAVSR